MKKIKIPSEVQTKIFQLRKQYLSTSKNISMNSLKDTVLRKTANRLKSIRDKDAFRDQKENKHANFYHASSQEYIPVKEIRNGVILTSDGRYVYIQEILPINFNQKSHAERNRIATAYGSIFKKKGPAKFSIKIMSDTSNPDAIIQNIIKNCKDQQRKEITDSLSDYIKLIRKLSGSGSVTRRYFMIFEYTGNSDGIKSTDFEEIYEALMDTKTQITNILSSVCNNICVEPENPTLYVTELLYYFFNRKTSREEPFDTRVQRITDDFNIYNAETGKNSEPLYCDLIAPKGIDFSNRNYIFMDGSYYGFIGLKSDFWPTDVLSGWLGMFSCGAIMDVDLVARKLPHTITIASLKQLNKITKHSIWESEQKNKGDKHITLSEKYRNNEIVRSRMSTGETLYDVSLILTLRCDTARQLFSIMKSVRHSLETQYGMETDSCYNFCEDYLKMTMPFLYFTSPFQKLHHNILGDDLASTYCYTLYEYYDSQGYVLGFTNDNNNQSIVSLNNYNTDLYKNANIIILGTAGAGKTFTEQLIGSRMLMNGIRCFYIIPKKGMEYYNGCKNIGGTYIQLSPGSTTCINILGIRPEGDLNTAVLGDDIIIQKTSLLAKKITNITIWLNLLLGASPLNLKESNRLNILMIQLYAQYEITEDNNSIYTDASHQHIKRMPILGDLLDIIKKENDTSLERISDVLSPFVSGNCRNMNGQTNVNLDNNYVVFDVDEDVIGELLLPAFLYIAFDFTYSEVKGNPFSKDAIFLDEAWKMMVNEECAKQVQNLVKIIRGYGGGAVVATQEPEDFINKNNDYGKSVLNNSDTKLLLNMKESSLALVQKELKLTTEECEQILQFKQGHGMLVSNGNKITLQIVPSEREYNAFTTNVNDRIASLSKK